MKAWQQPLPKIYNELSDAELRLRIEGAKEILGKRLVILGHHYQQDAIVDFADYTGDSFELSRFAAAQKQAEYVVFCGVHFMAESADILTPEPVRVILPDLGAGCSMADMANIDQTLECWAQLTETCPDAQIVPITYMNSSAAIKAFVGEHHGAVCTSSNCRNVLEWALESKDEGGRMKDEKEAQNAASAPSHSSSFIPHPSSFRKILFFPDQHLGRNTAHAMSYPIDKMVVWDPTKDLGGNTPEQIRSATFILWKGHCSVHQLFRPEHVDAVRREHPNMKVIVHPECRHEVVEKADLAGSTAYIVKQIEAAAPGSEWAIGTEVHLVNRLKQQHPEQTIIVLSECQCLCTTMFRIDLPHLCWVLENLIEGKVVNEIKVDAHTRKWATVALERMLAIKGTGNPMARSNSPIVSQAEANRMGVVD
jgi:quinolinate synthase